MTDIREQIAERLAAYHHLGALKAALQRLTPLMEVLMPWRWRPTMMMWS